MGQALCAEILNESGAELVAALTSPNSKHLGQKVCGTLLSCDVRAALTDCDVLIDFSHPGAAIHAVRMMYETPCRTFVTGTTGYTQTEEQALVAAAQSITLVRSGNFSIGIRVVEKLVKTTAGLLGEDWNINILDIHHCHKKDAPSGTALMLGAAAGEDRGISYTDQRRGEIIGEHHVTFASPFETVCLSHIANDRALFAKGALRAALWAVDREKGLYDMKDVLGL